MLLTTILTAARDGVEYLSQTRAAFEEQTEPVIFRDGGKLGNRLMMGQILGYFVHRKDFDRLLYLEDDVFPSRNLFQLAAQVEIPNHWPLLSFFDPRLGDRRPQRIAMNVEAFFYNQALLIPRRTAEEWIQRTFDHATPRERLVTSGNGCSMMTRRHLVGMGFKEYGLQLPNPIKHIGEHSAILKGATQVAGNPTFPGEEFDALDLLYQ